MKVTVMRLDGTSFNIEVKPDATVEDLKKKIEEDQGSEVYPVCRQILTYGGKFFKNETTLVEYNVTEGSSIVIMGKGIPKQAEPTVSQPSAAGLHANISTPVTKPECHWSQGLPSTSSNADGGSSKALQENPVLQESIKLLQDSPELLLPLLQEVERQGSKVPQYIKNHEVHFLRFFMKPRGEERNSGQLPNAVPPAVELTVSQPSAAGLHANISKPLDSFSQGLPSTSSNADGGSSKALQENPVLQESIKLLQDSPELLLPLLQEVERQGSKVPQYIKNHEVHFLRFFMKPRGEERNSGQLPNAVPPAVELTPEEEESIEHIVALVRLDRDVVLIKFLECNKDEYETIRELLFDYIVHD